MHYFKKGEAVTVVDSDTGFNGTQVVFDIVKEREYIDPITGGTVTLKIDPTTFPCYLLLDAMNPRTMVLHVFPQHELKKQYCKGDSFQSMMKKLKTLKFGGNK